MRSAFAALVVILTEGGLTTRWNEVRPVMPLGVVLATVGVAISVGVVACVAHFVLGLDWQIAVLLGAVTSPTDAAAVFSVLRRVPVRPRLRGALEAESGLNDAPTVLLVTLVSTGEVGEKGLLYFSGLVLYELVIGALFGFVFGWLSVGLIRRMALGSAGLYPLAVLSLAIISYAGGAVLLHVSGFAAVYVTSLVLGRAELPHRMATRSFVDGIAWLAQIGLFVMLGLLASPGRFRLNDVLLALVIGIAVTVVGRFASVAVSAAPFRLPWAEQTFIAWAGLRGAVPIVLATIPLAEGVPQADRIFDVVFVLVLLFTLLQGPSLPWLARRLGVLDENAAYEVDIDVAPLSSGGDRLSAARLALKLADDHVGRGLFAVAHGWFANAERLLEGQPESAEHGVLMMMRGIKALFVEGDLPGAISEFDGALELSHRLGDRDTHALALVGKGRALVKSGDVEQGLALLDEATASAVCGELRPFSTGLVYCVTISSCQDLGDYRRAAEWTEVANRWCDRLDVTGFPGACRIHRAEIMRMRGEWPQAEEQAIAACEELYDFDRHITAGGYYEIGEIRRRRGDFAAAMEAYAKADELGGTRSPAWRSCVSPRARSTAPWRRSRGHSRKPRIRSRASGAYPRRSRSRSRRAT